MRGIDLRELGDHGIVATPIQAVGEQQLLARLRLGGRIPEGHDIVEGLVRSRDLHQHDRAASPVASGLDPYARSQVVEHSVVLVVGKTTVSLHEPETARMII